MRYNTSLSSRQRRLTILLMTEHKMYVIPTSFVCPPHIREAFEARDGGATTTIEARAPAQSKQLIYMYL